MAMKYALWGTRKGDEVWQEQLLLSDATAEQCDRIAAMAERDGFTNVRRTIIDDAPPDFTRTLTL